MAVRCPNCSNLLNPSTLHCGGRSCPLPKFRVARVMKKDFWQYLNSYLERFETIREEQGYRIKDTTIYPNLPYIDNVFGKNESEWYLFRRDLKIIRNALKGRSKLEILNYGSWNGWLSNRLVLDGHRVTAIGYFIDEFDGLGAKQYFPSEWLAIQTDLDDLSILEKNFDAIIFNRGIQFEEKPAIKVNTLINKLRPDGILIITGIDFYRDPRKRARDITNLVEDYRKKYNFNLFIRPTKGYIDRADIRDMKTFGMQLHRYPGMWGSHLRSILSRVQLIPFYGVVNLRAAPQRLSGSSVLEVLSSCGL
jgi:2-polyprenyl-3-methyl-5-hydroxy-6-metoxy-1,4-benzoquinol methylase